MRRLSRSAPTGAYPALSVSTHDAPLAAWLVAQPPPLHQGDPALTARFVQAHPHLAFVGPVALSRAFQYAISNNLFCWQHPEHQGWYGPSRDEVLAWAVALAQARGSVPLGEEGGALLERQWPALGSAAEKVLVQICQEGVACGAFAGVDPSGPTPQALPHDVDDKGIWRIVFVETTPQGAPLRAVARAVPPWESTASFYCTEGVFRDDRWQFRRRSNPNGPRAAERHALLAGPAAATTQQVFEFGWLAAEGRYVCRRKLDEPREALRPAHAASRWWADATCEDVTGDPGRKWGYPPARGLFRLPCAEAEWCVGCAAYIRPALGCDHLVPAAAQPHPRRRRTSA